MDNVIHISNNQGQVNYKYLLHKVTQDIFNFFTMNEASSNVKQSTTETLKLKKRKRKTMKKTKNQESVCKKLGWETNVIFQRRNPGRSRARPRKLFS